MTHSDQHILLSATAPEITAEFPLSAIQTQLWHQDQLTPGDPALNIAMRWEIRGTLSSDSLERAFQHVIARHEMLRTRFGDHDGTPLQQVLAEVRFKLGLVDIRAMAPQDHAARIDQIARHEAKKPFDLTAPCPLRATLVRVSAAQAFLLIVVHHAVFDGYSIGVLGREIGIAATAFEAGKTPTLPELALQYGDFCLWQQEYLACGVLKDESRYWRDQMQGASYFEVTPDHARTPRRSSIPGHVHLDLPAGFGASLTSAARAQGVSAFAFGAAVASTSLHRMTGAKEVLFGTPIAGRNEVDLEPLIGALISTQVLRLATNRNMGFAAHLQRTQKVVEGAIAHQNLPFSKLVEMLNPVRELSRTPLVSMNFNLQHVFMQDQNFGRFELISHPARLPGAARDIDIMVTARASGWRLNVEYCKALYDQVTMARLAAQIAQGFEFAFANPTAPLRQFPQDATLAARHSPVDPGLAAVKAALAKYPHSHEVAAVATPNGYFAFVSPTPDCPTPLEQLPGELMAFAATHLEAREMPVGISILATIPRDAKGALALPAPPALAAVEPRQTALARTANPDIKAKLARLWSEILALESPPQDISFFDLGGHSLLAVRLMSRIRKLWDSDLGVAAIYQFPTINGLAAEIGKRLDKPGVAVENSDPSDRQIEPISATGPGQQIIAINDIAITLATTQKMQPRHPATCIRLFAGAKGIMSRARHFEDIAAEAARLIKRAQPQGPYLLFGVCVHGNIALEAARILQSEGAEITGVIVKDVWEPGYSERIKARFSTRLSEKFYALFNKIRMVCHGHLTFSAMLGSYRVIRASGIMQLAVGLGLIDRVRRSDLTEDQEAFVAYVSAARDRYRPAPIRFPVLHVVTKISAQGWGFSPSLGWENVVERGLKTVHLRQIFVDHGHEQGAVELAQEMDQFLKRG